MGYQTYDNSGTMYASIKMIGRGFKKAGLLKNVNFTKTIKVGEHYIKIPVIRGFNVSTTPTPGFKTDLLEYISSKIKIDCFVDVGANIGQTLQEVYIWKKDINYYGFEPSPTAFEMLKEFAKINKISAELFPWACSANNEPIKLFALSAIDDCATIVQETRPLDYENVRGEWVCSYTLDSLKKELNLAKNFILKIDVEGAELKVLAGAKNTVSEFRPIIICEVLHAASKSELAMNDENKKNIQAFLEQNKYLIYLCELSKGRLTNLHQIKSFPSQVYHDSPDTCDYLFLPMELDGSFVSYADLKSSNQR